MPRNGNGQFSLAESPFVPNTVISSAAVNSDFSDIADALTESLARDGQGGMQAVLPMDATGFTYNNDTNTGMYRTGADAQAIKCGGIDIVDITASGADVTGDLTVSGNITGKGGIPPGFMGPYAGSTAPSGWLLCYGQSLLRASYVALFAAIGTAYGTVDSTHFSLPDLRGRLAAGKDDMGGSAASRLTSTTMTPDGATLGATGGAQTETIAQTNLPAITLATAIASGQGSHGHSTVGASAAGGTPNQVQILTGNGAFSFVTGNAVLPAMVGTTPLGGSGTALTTVQPSIITNYIIFAGV